MPISSVLPAVPAYDKKPTLAAMDRDMREWAHQSFELKTRSAYEGRMHEFGRAKIAFNDLTVRDEQLVVQAGQLKAELAAVREAKSEGTSRLELAEEQLRALSAQHAEDERKMDESTGARQRAEDVAAVLQRKGRTLSAQVEVLENEVSTLKQAARSSETHAKVVALKEQIDQGVRKEETRLLYLRISELDKEVAASEERRQIESTVMAYAARELRAESAALQAELMSQAEAHAGEVEGVMCDMGSQAAAARGKEEELVAVREMELSSLIQREKTTRTDLFVRQIARRMLRRDLASGFGSWVALWKAKTYAGKMCEIANRLNLKLREVANAFYFWAEEGRTVELEKLQSIDEQQGMMLERRDKEITRLKMELMRLDPPPPAGAYARNKLEKQKKLAGKRKAQQGQELDIRIQSPP